MAPLLRGPTAGGIALAASISKPASTTKGLIEERDELVARRIKEALEQCHGSITDAAKLLGISYQHLAYLLNNRHKDLLSMRKPVKRRLRPFIKGKGRKKKRAGADRS